MVGLYKHDYLHSCFYVKNNRWFLVSKDSFYETANQSRQPETLVKLSPKELVQW